MAPASARETRRPGNTFVQEGILPVPPLQFERLPYRKALLEVDGAPVGSYTFLRETRNIPRERLRRRA